MTTEIIEIGIEAFPDLPEFDGWKVKRIESEGGQWGVLFGATGQTHGAYYGTRKHPDEWTPRECAVALQHSINFAFMTHGPPAEIPGQSVIDAGPRIHDAIHNPGGPDA